MRNKIALALVAVLFTAGVVLAGAAYEGVRQATGQTWYKTGLTGNHSRTSATPVDLQTIQGDDAYVKVQARGSVEGATACFAVYTAGTDGVLDSIADIQTVTFLQDNLGSTGFLPVAPLYFPVDGESYYDVRCIARSSGTVSIKAKTCGSFSGPAE